MTADMQSCVKPQPVMPGISHGWFGIKRSVETLLAMYCSGGMTVGAVRFGAKIVEKKEILQSYSMAPSYKEITPQ